MMQGIHDLISYMQQENIDLTDLSNKIYINLDIKSSNYSISSKWKW